MNTCSTAAPLLAPKRTGLARHSLARAMLAVGGAFCVAAAGLALWPEQAAAAAPAEVATPYQRAAAPVRHRCDTCGVIENIRHSESKDGTAAYYEFDVRLPNGSLRQSRDTQAGIWQVGERMQLLGGERTWSAQ
ncbi:hypothetical protein WG902_12575 [Ramlibacter sp. PS3R-8]|uniref:hypothetical protein n=1 Tax=Ramlibacter sp. PS3R-8 TaxID=3133437 RepID=UPI00309C37EB